MINNPKYVIVSPVRNEERQIEKTILSVTSQRSLPLRWVIVDDGSTDNTTSIVSRYLSSFPWIELVQLSDRGYYDLMTGGEIKAFYRGYEKIRHLEFEFLSKLDGDISFDETYFESLLGKFEENSKLGIASGVCYNLENGTLVPERAYKHHVRGAARIYRKKCWDAIGGAIDDLGWDAIDVYKARMLGWETRSFEDVRMIHHVKTWTKGGLLHGRRRSGRMEYLIGTHPLFLTVKLAKAMFNWPYVIGSLSTAYGYLASCMRRERRVTDPELMAFIRKEQRGRLVQALFSRGCFDYGQDCKSCGGSREDCL